jgi:hypothetical protein
VFLVYFAAERVCGPWKQAGLRKVEKVRGLPVLVSAKCCQYIYTHLRARDSFNNA